MDWTKSEFWLSIFLVGYLLVVGMGSAGIVIYSFPEKHNEEIIFPRTDIQNGSYEVLPYLKFEKTDQGLMLLAFLAGIAGSFLHAAQSLSSYLGNGTFRASWTVWYFLRPWIGGVLGFSIYFALRAGLFTGTASVNPHGLVAFGLLGGWFSKTTTDKLQEVFETLFKTNEDNKRKDKLQVLNPPTINSIVPPIISSSTQEIFISGSDFLKGAVVNINGKETLTEFISETELKVSFSPAIQRPATGTKTQLYVKNPKGINRKSDDFDIEFQ